MGHQILSFGQFEVRRLIWIIVVTFSVTLLVHYIDPPYGNVLSSIFSTGSIADLEKSRVKAGNLSSNSEIVGNLTRVDDSNFAMTPAPLASTIISDGKEKGLGQDANGSAIEFSSEGLREPDQRNSTKKATSGSSDVDILSPTAAENLVNSSPNIVSPSHSDRNIRSPAALINSSSSSGEEDAKVHDLDEKSGDMHGNLPLNTSHPYNHSAAEEKHPRAPEPAIIPISEMNNLLLRNRSSYNSIVPKWSSRVDQEILDAKSQIENARIIATDASLYAPLYWNVSVFKRSYELMERMLKVYIYKEGQKPIFHQPTAVSKGIYASEGWFMKHLESDQRFVTKNPKKAHLFYLPYSSRMLVEKLYIPGSHSHDNLIQYLKNYVDSIAAKYPFWNRTGGADHFLVACHDWAPHETKQHMDKCVRALCNADLKQGFAFGKDVSLPETNVRSPKNLLKDLGGKPPLERSNLAFFAGKMHGYLRPVLLQYWGNKDPDMKIFGKMPGRKGRLDYIQLMKDSKYCICPRGYEVNSPRVVEAIFYECVPVIISDNYVPPFFEVLNWESFAVFVLEKDIPNLKNILLSIPEERYLEMQMRVKRVQQHFLWHSKPLKYDVFYMILHSVWYNRLIQIRPMNN